MKTILALAIACAGALASANAQITVPSTQQTLAQAATREEDMLKVIQDTSVPGHDMSNAWFPDLKTYVAEHISYPSVARDAGLEGVVTAEVVVGTDGDLSDIRITDGLCYSCDKEIRRLLDDMPAWNPARHKGQPVVQKVTLRMRFELQPF
jgi:protein TonB